MDYAVRQPGHDTEEGAGVGGENVTQVGPVKYVFESREDSDPYWGAPATRYESGEIELAVFLAGQIFPNCNA